MPNWDAFISHASEDKDAFVRPLARALTALGAKVWFDEFSLKIGDSLSRSIDEGLAQSRYGIVVLSPSFLKKPWPEHELRGLVSMEIAGASSILPIWHGVGRAEVLKFSPSLADKVAVSTVPTLDAAEVALKILSVIRADIYGGTPHADLQRLASGDAVRDLQAELDSLREDFLCPNCRAPLSESGVVPIDLEQKHWGMHKSFECGYMELEGQLKQPCPSSAEFPKLMDYELRLQEDQQASVSYHRWSCRAYAITVNARRLQLR